MKVGFGKKISLLGAIASKCVRDAISTGQGALADKVQSGGQGQFRHGARRAILLIAAAPFLSLYYLGKRKGRVATIMTCCVFALSALLLLEVNSIVYEYSYNGRVLGMVKSEDVLQKAIRQIDGKTIGAEGSSALPVNAPGNSGGSSGGSSGGLSGGSAVQAASLPPAPVPADAASVPAPAPAPVSASASALGEAPVSPVTAPDAPVQITIDENTDIQIKTVKMPLFSPAPTDSLEGVVSSLSSQPDVKVKAWEITADGAPLANLASEQSATEVKDGVLKALETTYLGSQDPSAFKQISFQEDVQIAEIETTADNLTKPEDAYTGILKDSKLHLRTVEDAQYKEVIPYETIYKDANDLYQGDIQVITPGVTGVKEVVGEIVKINGAETQRTEISSKITSDPQGQVAMRGTKPAPPLIGTGTFIVPTDSKSALITAVYGPRWGTEHEGTDYAVPVGSNVLASDTGRVIEVGWDGGYGITIKIDHGAGWVTLYGHLSQTNVQVGDLVKQGQLIAQSGSTGFSTGPHLHFSLYRFDKSYDTRSYVKNDPTPVELMSQQVDNKADNK